MRVLRYVLFSIIMCFGIMIMSNSIAIVRAEDVISKELNLATYGEHLNDNLLHTYLADEVTYAFGGSNGRV